MNQILDENIYHCYLLSQYILLVFQISRTVEFQFFQMFFDVYNFYERDSGKRFY